MSEPSLPEPLDDFLQHPPQLSQDAARQESLYQETTALLRQPARRRWPIAAAAAIVLMMLSAYFVWRSHNVEPVPKNLVERKDEPAPQDKPQPKPLPQDQPAPPVVVVKTNPLELEWSAFDAEEDRHRVRLYFQAGDLYLDKFNDYQSALRCYAQALDYCETTELEFNPDDNWLVMSLKRDRRKEP